MRKVDKNIKSTVPGKLLIKQNLGTVNFYMRILLMLRVLEVFKLTLLSAFFKYSSIKYSDSSEVHDIAY